MKKNKGYVYDYRSWKLRFFFHQNNFGPCQHSHHEWLHKIIHVKR